jgi:hypothetical protein
VELSRIAEFSPVTITRFTSTVLITAVSYLLHRFAAPRLRPPFAIRMHQAIDWGHK